jgi:hypothetical protein
MGQDAGATIFCQCQKRHDGQYCRFSSVCFRFEPEDKKVINFFQTLVGGQSRDIDGNIAQFLNMIARTIIVDDHFVYELQIGRDKNTKNIIEMNFSPVSAPHDKLLVYGRHVVQLLPSSVAESHSCSRIRRLDPNETIIFAAPRRWKSVVRNARSALRFFDAMKFSWMNQMTESKTTGRRMYEYDYSSNLKMLARATAPLGWTGRGLFQDYTTFYQDLERKIRWNTFCIDLRNHMIRGLEVAVQRIADIMNSKCRLIIEEKSEYTLDDVRKKLQEGKTSTVEIVKLLF